MGNEASVPVDGQQPGTQQRNAYSDEDHQDETHFDDPVMAAAARGAAAKRRKTGRPPPAPQPFVPMFRMDVDNEWKASLQRFAETAASTAKTVAAAAEPMLSEAAQTVGVNAEHYQMKQEAQASVSEDTDTIQALGATASSSGIAANQTPLPKSVINIATPQLVEESHETPLVQEHTLDKNAQQNGLPKSDADDPTEYQIPLKPPVNHTPMRRRQAAPVVSTPNAFGGAFASAYSTVKKSLTTPTGDSPLSSIDGITNGGLYRLKKPSGSATDLSSVASSQTGESSARRLVSFQDRQQQLLATPKQFVELVSQKLNEDRPISNGRRRGRRRHRVPSKSRTPDYPQSWLRNGRLDNSTIFDRHQPTRSPSLSPPGSPITAAVDLDLPKPERRKMPTVTLWDMIPTEDSELLDFDISEKSDCENVTLLPAPILRQSIVMDPSPSQFMTKVTSFADEMEDLSAKRKRRLDEEKSVDGVYSVMSGSMSSEGSMKRSKLDAHRRKPYRLRRSIVTNLPRTPPAPGKSPKRHFSDDEGDGDSEKRRRFLSLNASGLYAEAAFDPEGMQLPDDEDEMLNEALMAFSTMTNLSLANEFPKIVLPHDLEYVASIRWRQLVAHWKHSEMSKAMVSRPCSLHFNMNTFKKDDPSFDWSSSAETTTVDRYTRSMETVFGNRSVLVPSTMNRSGLTPSYPFELKSLTRFVTHIGMGREPAPTKAPTGKGAKLMSGKRVKRQVGKSVKSQSGGDDALSLAHEIAGDATVENLLHAAGEKHKSFSTLIESMKIFSSKDYIPSQAEENNEEYVSSSVDIKDARAISLKADRKYTGDLLSVKDVLRAQIVFPTEGALVCAFCFLDQYCKLSALEDGGSKIVGEIGLKLEIVRIKNLFAVTPTGQPSLIGLPTGYRHVLVTVRLDDALLAEIQLQLAPFYNILGEDGYHLHREIIDAKLATSAGGKISADGSTNASLALLDGFIEQHSKVCASTTLHS